MKKHNEAKDMRKERSGKGRRKNTKTNEGGVRRKNTGEKERIEESKKW